MVKNVEIEKVEKKEGGLMESRKIVVEEGWIEMKGKKIGSVDEDE